MAFAAGRDIGKRLQAAMGLDGLCVRRIRIDVEPGEIIVAHVEVMMEAFHVEKLTKFVESCQWEDVSLDDLSHKKADAHAAGVRNTRDEI